MYPTAHKFTGLSVTTYSK